jgi:secreted PhoX family phosphatase
LISIIAAIQVLLILHKAASETDRGNALKKTKPAPDSVKYDKNTVSPSTFKNPLTRWPYLNNDMPPRPSIIVITKKDGGPNG